MIFEIYLVLYYIVQILTFVWAFRKRDGPPGDRWRGHGGGGMLFALLVFISTSIHTVIMVSVFVSMMIDSKPWELKHTIAIVPLIILAGETIFNSWRQMRRREKARARKHLHVTAVGEQSIHPQTGSIRNGPNSSVN
jgi:hypothetical protein